jgi:hypothetical protein
MVKFKQNLFSTTPSVLKKGTVAMLCTLIVGLFVITGCIKDKSVVSTGGEKGGRGETPEYPIEIPFTEYSLLETPCQWVQMDDEEYVEPHVIIVNSDKELENYIACWEGSYPEIDFAKQTLLLARGISSCSAYAVCNSLQQLSEQSYEMKVDYFLGVLGVGTWYTPIIVNKLNKECTVELLINKKTEQ